MGLERGAHVDRAQGRPVCITGMHRTGTSVVAALLNRHGLWLGDEADMMAANPYNPDGYFENDGIVALDNAILATFGGSWSTLPALTGEWTEDPRLLGLKSGARAIGQGLAASHLAWGFKDPRAALTLPFWRSVWGDLTVVVALRNPLETARSLKRRDGMPIEQGLALWQAHYLSLLNLTTPETRIVVAYETVCADPVGTANALLDRLPGLAPVDAAAVCDTVRPALWHFRETPADLAARGVPHDVLELYAQLQAEAINPEPHVQDDLASMVRSLPAAIAGLDLAIRDVHVELQRLAAVVARLEGERRAAMPAIEPAPEPSTNGRRD